MATCNAQPIRIYIMIREYMTNLSELLHEFTIGDDDHTKRKDKTCNKKGDDVGVVIVISRVPRRRKTETLFILFLPTWHWYGGQRLDMQQITLKNSWITSETHYLCGILFTNVVPHVFYVILICDVYVMLMWFFFNGRFTEVIVHTYNAC